MEMITLKWSMDDESWSHWAQGRGKETASFVVLEGLCAIRENQDALEKIRSTARSLSYNFHDPPRDPPHTIENQLPAADWGEACQRVGEPGNPVRPSQLLAAVILESKSWKQVGNAVAEKDAGWNRNSLISSVDLSTKLTHTKQINL